MKNSFVIQRGAIHLVALTLLVALLIIIIAPLSRATAAPLAATSPTLGESNRYSVLGGQAVTCTGPTTTNRRVGVSPGTSITGFPSPCTAGKGTEPNTASAIAAQADSLSVFGALDQTCDQSFGAVDLTVTFPSGVGPGVYCSTSSFSLSGNLNLTGSGVWIFKTVSTLITSPNSSVTGGDPCNVWWRIGSSTTLDTSTSFIGTVISQNGINAMNSGATLNGRFLALSAGTVTLDSNTISSAGCGAPVVRNSPAPTATSAPANTEVPAPTATTVAAPTEAATTAPIVGLPSTGGGPQPRNDSVWGMLLAVPVVGALIGGLGLLKRRRARQAKG